MNANSPRLFETDYTINGEHAMRLKFLAKKIPATTQSPIIPVRRKFLSDILMFT